jgi:hypothetical protein
VTCGIKAQFFLKAKFKYLLWGSIKLNPVNILWLEKLLERVEHSSTQSIDVWRWKIV